MSESLGGVVLECPHCGWSLKLVKEYIEDEDWFGIFSCTGMVNTNGEKTCGEIEVVAKTPVDSLIGRKVLTPEYLNALEIQER